MRISDWSSDVCSSDLKAAVRKTGNPRERFLTCEEVKKLGEAFDRLEADCTNPKAIAIAGLWALTGCRRNEIAGLKWREVDLDRGFLMFKDSKTGRSVRPLGRAAVEILRGVKQTDASEFVFPSTAGESFFPGTKGIRSEEHTSELQSIMRISSAVFCS